ncbi:MAG: hypothetical protein ABI866_11170 [Dokdonella sp.]
MPNYSELPSATLPTNPDAKDYGKLLGRHNELRALNPVQLLPASIFEMTEIRNLLTMEWEHARNHSLAVADGRALSITPVSVLGKRERAFSAHPQLTRLHLLDGMLAGDLISAVDLMPFDDECMQVIVVRHLFDDPAATTQMGNELMRILAPGGVMIFYDFNPLSSWRIWWLRQAMQGMSAPNWNASGKVRRTIASGGRVSIRRDYLGGSWPLEQSVFRLTAGRRWHGVCCVEVRKERQSSRPVPLAARRRRVVLNPELAQFPSRRIGL